MNNKNVVLVILLLLFIAVEPSRSQAQSRYNYPSNFERNSFFFLVGYTNGPYFDDFTDWANDYYHETYESNDSIGNFSGGFDFSIGLRIRFSRHFASEFDFLTYTMNIRKQFKGTGIHVNESVSHDLELNVAIISGAVLVLFDFTDNQHFVPFIGTGLSVFPLRLDHRIDFRERHTKTALTVNFSAGLDVSITSKLWTTIRCDWTLGKANMPVSQIQYESGSLSPASFSMDLSTTQIQAGIMYGFQ